MRTECKNILPPLSDLTDIPAAGQVIASRSDIQMVSRKAAIASENYRESVSERVLSMSRNWIDLRQIPLENGGINYSQEVKPFTGRVSVSAWLGSR